MLTLTVEGGEPPEIEATEDNVVVYGAAGTRLHVRINGTIQDTGSAEIPVPSSGRLSTRETVAAIFGRIAEMRPGGIPMPLKRSRWSFVRGLFSRHGS